MTFSKQLTGFLWQVISLLKVLHCYFKVDFEIDFVPHSLACVIGVKQGDTLGPALFIIFSATIMITWRKAHNRPLCIFRTKEDFKITDKRYNTKGTDFALKIQSM